MDTNTLIQLATLISVIVGVVGLLIAVRGYKRQVNTQFFLEYTKRYDDIIQSFPPGAWASRFNPAEELPAPSDELSMSILRYLNFVSQFQYFAHKGYIPKSVWRANEGELARTLGSPLFIREWKTIAPELSANRAFCQFVESVQRASDGEMYPTHAQPNNGMHPTPRHGASYES